MPQGIELPDVLKKEIQVGGRSIPLLVPVVGLGIAVVLLVVSRLGKGKAGGGEQAATAGAEQAAVQQSETFMSALQQAAGELGGQIQALQGDVASQMAGITGQVQAEAAQRAALEQTLLGQIGGLQTTVSGFQAGLEEQATALQTGLSGVTSQMQAYQGDINARMTAAEQATTQLQQAVTQIQQSGLSPKQRDDVARGLNFFINSVTNPVFSSLGKPTWETAIGPVGTYKARPTGGYWQTVWGG